MEDLINNLERYLEEIKFLRNEISRIIKDFDKKDFENKIELFENITYLIIRDLISWLNWFRNRVVPFDKLENEYLTLLTYKVSDFLIELFNLDERYVIECLKKLKGFS